ncbi:MAG TPA: acetyl-CoA carboxylase biotin carboxyl carrier protein [Candidatus Omnitrophota bacterium]|nr:acetyl-CoA carboxylase biotin carboxyl carrier protein [Candidatus Omnitrophota bacterium]
MVDFNLLKKLIETVKQEDISGLSIEEGGVKYEIKRERGAVMAAAPAPIAHPAEAPAPKAEKAAEAKAKPAKDEDEGLLAVTSPMVGTFYRSPSPDSPPFINVGDQVNAGKVVCIIEAMKLFNEIESEVSGKIVKILVENGKTVEYGQKLMLVKKE